MGDYVVECGLDGMEGGVVALSFSSKSRASSTDTVVIIVVREEWWW